MAVRHYKSTVFYIFGCTAFYCEVLRTVGVECFVFALIIRKICKWKTDTDLVWLGLIPGEDFGTLTLKRIEMWCANPFRTVWIIRG